MVQRVKFAKSHRSTRRPRGGRLPHRTRRLVPVVVGAAALVACMAALTPSPKITAPLSSSVPAIAAPVPEAASAASSDPLLVSPPRAASTRNATPPAESPRAASPAAPLAPRAAASRCSMPRTVCLAADRSTQLRITTPNTVVDGQGHKVPSILIKASGVTVQHFRVAGGEQAGIWSEGTNNVIADNDISDIAFGEDDVDAIRFFGSGTKILRNRVHDLVRGPQNGAHVDCMQTYASSLPGSSNVVIAGNDCRGQDLHQCLMAEGPGSTDGGGGGSGASRNWQMRDNRFECFANQSISLRDIDDVTITGNRFLGSGGKAVQVTDGSTNVKVSGNTLGPGYRALLGN